MLHEARSAVQNVRGALDLNTNLARCNVTRFRSSMAVWQQGQVCAGKTAVSRTCTAMGHVTYTAWHGFVRLYLPGH
jgi:hypothetical protein